MDNKEKNKENIIDIKYTISSSPHLLKNETTRNIMWLVILCLLPVTFFGIFAFGIYSGIIVLVSILTSVLTEVVVLKIRKKRIAIDDGAAFLTGLLIGLNMPPFVPLYIPIISCIFAIALVKQAFGGLGENWANPAIAARVFALLAWAKPMTTWAAPFAYNNFFSFDAVTSPTPLGLVNGVTGASVDIPMSSSSAFLSYFQGIFSGPLDIVNQKLGTSLTHLDLFFGFKGGCIGEISVFLLLAGAVLLICKKIITLDIPVAYIGTVIILVWIFDGLNYNKGLFQGDFLFHILTGGLALGAFFMATDMVTTPITIKGRIIFGIGCGLLTVLIRLFAGYPEGVSLSILFMNMLTPAIDKFVKVKPMGLIKKKA